MSTGFQQGRVNDIHTWVTAGIGLFSGALWMNGLNLVYTILIFISAFVITNIITKRMKKTELKSLQQIKFTLISEFNEQWDVLYKNSEGFSPEKLGYQSGLLEKKQIERAYSIELDEKVSKFLEKHIETRKFTFGYEVEEREITLESVKQTKQRLFVENATRAGIPIESISNTESNTIFTMKYPENGFTRDRNKIKSEVLELENYTALYVANLPNIVSVKRQVRLAEFRPDIVARDKNGKRYVIELKITNNQKKSDRNINNLFQSEGISLIGSRVISTNGSKKSIVYVGSITELAEKE